MPQITNMEMRVFASGMAVFASEQCGDEQR